MNDDDNKSIYSNTIDVRELPEIVTEIEKFKDDNAFIDTTPQAIRVLIRRGLMASGYLNSNKTEQIRKWKNKTI